jgi:hypothetical protein
LRVGIVCLSKRFSGSVTQNLSLAAGANTIFVEILENRDKLPQPHVDALIVVGGIDCSDVPLMQAQLAIFEARNYRHQALIYAGNRHLAPDFQRRYPEAIIVRNPLGDDLKLSHIDLLKKIRNLYLDDLIQKEGVSNLQRYSEIPIWPTPAIVSLAAEQMEQNKSKLRFPSPCVVIDIGGATTDVHYGLEIVNGGIGNRLSSFQSLNRYVFTELGVHSSRESTISRLSMNERLYEFLQVVYGKDVSRAYLDFREGHIDKDCLFYACFFLALDSLSKEIENGVPHLSLEKVACFVITGGASQRVDAAIMSRITALFDSGASGKGPDVFLDTNYEIWVEGMKSFPGALPLGTAIEGE